MLKATVLSLSLVCVYFIVGFMFARNMFSGFTKKTC